MPQSGRRPQHQKQTSAHVRVMSALPPKADIDQHGRDVRFVPKADIALPRISQKQDTERTGVGSRQRHYRDLFPKRRARGDRRIPAIEVRRRRPLGNDLHVAVHHDAERNVAVGKVGAGHEFCLAELLVHDLRRRDCLFLAGFDGFGVALFRWGPNQAQNTG